MNELDILREKMDLADDKLIAAFTERMNIAAQIAAYKKERRLPVYQPQREQEKITRISSKADENLREYIPALYETVFRVSRAYQDKLIKQYE